MTLSGRQIGLLSNAICKNFTFGELRQILKTELDKDIEDITVAQNYELIAFEVVNTASRQGWEANLIAAARAKRPRSQSLRIAAATLGPESIRAVNIAQKGLGPQTSETLGALPVSSARFERAVRICLRLVGRLAELQDLYTQLSKMTELLLYYRTILTNQGPSQQLAWQMVEHILEVVSGKVIAIERDYRTLNDERTAMVGERLTMFSRRMGQARALQRGAVGDMEKHLEVMRIDALRMRDYVKKQLESKLKEAIGATDLGEGRRLLRMWERAFRQYQLWDNCSEFVLGIQNRGVEGFWDIAYERAQTASEASEDVLEVINNAGLSTDLDYEATNLREAVEPVLDMVDNRSEEIEPTVRAAKDSARGLAEAACTNMKDWIEDLVERPFASD
jgi:hypothetical protein